MIVNVDDLDFRASSDELKKLDQDVFNMNREVTGAIGDSEIHISTCRDKVDGRIAKWQSKLNLLESRRRVLEDKIKVCRNNLEKKQQEARRIRDELSRLRPPKQVSYTITDENGNRHTYTYTEDPDGPRRAQLQCELEAVCRDIAKYTAELEKLVAEHNTVVQDISNVNAYLDKMRRVQELIKSAAANLQLVSQYAEEGSSYMMSECSAIDSAISDMQEYISRYNEKTYYESHLKGICPSIAIPSFGGASFAPRSSYTPGTFRSRRDQRSSNQLDYSNDEDVKKKKDTLPNKLKIVSSEKCIVEIVGPYNDKDELALDINKLASHLDSKLTLKVKKPISNAVPCFGNIKEIDEFLSSRGYKGRVTAMGTRYTDPEGYIYFVS